MFVNVHHDGAPFALLLDLAYVRVLLPPVMVDADTRTAVVSPVHQWLAGLHIEPPAAVVDVGGHHPHTRAQVDDIMAELSAQLDVPLEPPPVDIIPAEDLAELTPDMHLLGAVVGSGDDRWMVPPIMTTADGGEVLDRRLVSCWRHVAKPPHVDPTGVDMAASQWAGLPPMTPNADPTVAAIVWVLGDLANDLGVTMWPPDGTP